MKNFNRGNSWVPFTAYGFSNNIMTVCLFLCVNKRLLFIYLKITHEWVKNFIIIANLIFGIWWAIIDLKK